MITFNEFYELVSMLVKQSATSNPYSLASDDEVMRLANLKLRMIYEQHPRKYTTTLMHELQDHPTDPTLSPPIEIISFDGTDESGRSAGDPWPDAVVIEWVKVNHTNPTIPLTAGSRRGHIFMHGHKALRFTPNLMSGYELTLYGTFYPEPIALATDVLDTQNSITLDYLRFVVAQEIFANNLITPPESFYASMQEVKQTFMMSRDVFRQQTKVLGWQGRTFGRR